MYMFGYVSSAETIDVFGVLFENPDGDANNRNTSQVGLVLAADSIAHACLFIQKLPLG